MKLITTLIFALTTLVAVAQNTAPKATLELDMKKAMPGAKLTGTLTVVFAEGLHAYQNPPSKDYQVPLTLTTDSKGFKITPKYPKGMMRESMGELSALYEGTVKIPVTIEFPKTAGAYTLKISVNYQQCNESTCFPPGTVVVESKVTLKKPSTKKINP
ncbi:MAG TPA: protein-disulfide reductase DsbD family protein [Fimbriimonadaceae bacterium]|nr:protein-disulfide reductase DsbD family protein [Fimbriimonadaceae bacterium]